MRCFIDAGHFALANQDAHLLCRASIGRLGVDKLALYQIHWPAFATNFWCNDAFVQARSLKTF